MKKSIIILISSISVLVLLFVAYICAAIVPYASGKDVSEEFKNSFNIDNFYSDTIGKERVALLDDPQQSFYYRMKVVEEAQEEIIFSSYSTEDGNSTRIFLGALLQKAEEGVKVKIVLDGKFSGITSGSGKLSGYALLSNENVELYYYNKLNVLRPDRISACLHDKYLIVDNKYLILGGRNVGDKYYGDSSYSGTISYDREVLVYNPGGEVYEESAIRQTKEYYSTIISQSVCKMASVSQNKLSKGAERYSELISKSQSYYAQNSDDIDYGAVTVAANKITLIYNPATVKVKEPWIGYTLYKFAMNSQDVFIQSPYTVLKKKNIAYLNNITANCSNVTMLTNSLASTPNIAYSNYYVKRKSYISAGLKIYEYQSTSNSIHAKTYLFDQDITVIGSFNLDERSLYTDTECMLVIQSEEFNSIVRGTVQSYIDSSLEVGADNKYIQSQTVQECDVSAGKKFIYTAGGTLLRPLISLL